VVLFCHSLLSDWNHGNAHFLRGIAGELHARGVEVRAFEPRDGWSVQNLVAEQGEPALQLLSRVMPWLSPERYAWPGLDLEEAVDGADLVLVHEWNEPSLVAALGGLRARGGRFRLLFHDTHHRRMTAPEEMRRFDLSAYDGVLAFGEVLRSVYETDGWGRHAWTWHEAADVRIFHPLAGVAPRRDLVWVGNWGDDERTRELRTFLLEPVERLGLSARVHGVRYPDRARAELAAAGAEFAGWISNLAVPRAFAEARMTVHVPRRPYAESLPGIPTIRVFEALACGIPLISAPWSDEEELFRPGQDYLLARSGQEMERHLRAVREDRDLACGLAASGLQTVLARHTCAHRVDALLAIARSLGVRTVRTAEGTRATA
jgi:spore maturation protein CgeB